MKKQLSKISILGLIITTLVLSCKEEVKQEITKVEKVPGINIEFMDNTINPKDDFYKYVNGKWLEENVIPEDRTRWGSFSELRKKTDDDALGILKSVMSDNKDLSTIEIIPGSDQEKAVQLFETIMDTTSRNTQGIDPLKPYLTKISEISNIDDLQNYIIEMEPTGGAGFFGFGVRAHPKNSNLNTGYLGAASLGLPDRDYYVKDDEDSKEKRNKYVAHISRMLQFLGDSEENAIKSAKQILAFETRLAEPKMDKVDRRDARKRFNPRSISQLQEMVPAINWNNYFKGIGVKKVDTVIVTEVKYMGELQKVLSDNKIDDWKSFLRWHLLNESAHRLSTTMEKANWDFYSKELGGAKAQRPREETALQTLNWTVGEALGKLYVQEKFPPEAKERAEKMINNVVLAYKNRIKDLPWMTEGTKEKAIEKLMSIKIKIAYPDKWKDYSKMDIKGVVEGGTYLENMINAATHNYAEDIEKLGKPVDKSEWYMAPQVVNAYFNPPFNEIVFPAAILQPPFYNYTADDAVNYGGIGAVIGHEISHSFDDSGSRYDKDGNLNNWWTDEDLEKFTALGDKLAEQYSALEVLPNVNINGKFTLGENIGDLGGLNAAYDALQLSFKGVKPENIDSFTAEQRFFMSWATVWRTLSREEALKTQIKTDPHSPGIYRATQPLLNIDAFYEAFDIKEENKMYLAPEERVKIW